MFQKKLLASAIAGVAALSLSSLALADNNAVYVGLQGGYADTHWDNLYQEGSSTVEGTVISSVKDKRAAGRLFAGYDFNKYLGVEVGGTYIDKTKITSTLSGNLIPLNSIGAANLDIKEYAFDLLGKVTAPLAYGFDVYAKAGLGYLRAKGDAVGTISGFSDNGTSHHYGPAYGAGVGYEITPNWVVDASWLHYSGQNNTNSNNYVPNVDLGLIGITYKFPVG